MSALLSWRLLVPPFIIVAVVLAWQHGRKTGAQAEVEFHMKTLAAERDAWASSNIELEATVSELRIQRDVARQANATLRESLDGNHRLSIEDAAELALYRRIAGAEGTEGLSVDAVKLSAGPPDMLHITLVHVRGRGRVSGAVGVTLAGEQTGQTWRRVIVAADSGDAPTYNLRFFETVAVVLPEDLEKTVDQVEITILPSDSDQQPIQYAMAWGEIEQGRP